MISDIQQQRSQYYCFMGKVASSLNDHILTDETEALNNSVRENALVLKKILSSDASLAAKRYQWTNSTVYTQWDHTVQMENEPFYVITSANKIYKCISNNVGASSTVEPTGNAVAPFTTADGYIWKYMYSIPSFKYSKFASPDFIPVQKAISNKFYNTGKVEYANIVDAGSGYSSSQSTQIVVTGPTTGSGASVKIATTPSGGIYSFFDIVPGSGYTLGGVCTFVSSSGTGAILTPVFVGGQLASFAIVEPGYGYSHGETVEVIGGAVIVPSISSTGSIEKLNIINPGAGYTSSPTLTVTSTGAGAGVYGNASAVVECVAIDGEIVNTYIVDPGVDYPQTTSTSITVTGDGTGALFKPVVYNGKLIDVIVENSGSGYTNIKLDVIGAGTGAKVTAAFTQSDFTSDQSIVEQTVIPGAVYTVKVTNGGNNYTNTTVITHSGDGVGFSASLTIVGGVITKVNVINPGSGYSYLDIFITDINRGIVGTVIDASAYAILPPNNGHGYDAVSELFGTTLLVYSEFRQNGIDEIVLQDYRQFGIFKDLTTPTSNAVFTDNSSIIAYKVQLTPNPGTSAPVIDEVLYTWGAYNRYRVISIVGDVVYLQAMGNRNVVPSGLMGSEVGGRFYTVTNVISKPSVNKYSGKLLYVSFVPAVTFSDTQGVVIKTVLKF
jgi:hypothetical protein